MRVHRIAGANVGGGNLEVMESPDQEDRAGMEQDQKGKGKKKAFDKIGSVCGQASGPDGGGDVVESSPNPAAPVAFSFDGEYSIIAPAENVAGKMGTHETWKRVAKVVREIQRSTRLKFRYVHLPSHEHTN